MTTNIGSRLFETDPEVTPEEVPLAMATAVVLLQTGETHQADLLLERALKAVQTLSDRIEMWPSVHIYFLQGKSDQALFLLRKSVDEGWGSRYLNDLTQLRPWHFREAGVLDQPGFQALITDMRAEMVRQLAVVRDIEREATPSL